MLMAGAGYRVIPGAATISDIRATPTTANGSMSVNANGTLTYVGNASGGPTRWQSDPGTPGAYTWARWTDTTGQAATGGFVAGTVYALTTGIVIGWAHAGTYIASGTGSLNFYADAGATQLLGTITLTIDVESS